MDTIQELLDDLKIKVADYRMRIDCIRTNRVDIYSTASEQDLIDAIKRSQEQKKHSLDIATEMCDAWSHAMDEVFRLRKENENLRSLVNKAGSKRRRD